MRPSLKGFKPVKPVKPPKVTNLFNARRETIFSLIQKSDIIAQLEYSLTMVFKKLKTESLNASSMFVWKKCHRHCFFRFVSLKKKVLPLTTIGLFQTCLNWNDHLPEVPMCLVNHSCLCSGVGQGLCFCLCCYCRDCKIQTFLIIFTHSLLWIMLSEGCWNLIKDIFNLFLERLCSWQCTFVTVKYYKSKKKTPHTSPSLSQLDQWVPSLLYKWPGVDLTSLNEKLVPVDNP